MNKSTPSDEIALFVRVVERGSFAAAAQETGLTPSGISKVVSRLESRLGVSLLQRTTRRLVMTAEGETLLMRGREILGTTEAMEAEITATRGKPKSPDDLKRHSCLRVTAAGSLAQWWMRAGDGLAPFKVMGWITCDSVDGMCDMVRNGIRSRACRASSFAADLKSGALARPSPVRLPRGRAVSVHRADAAGASAPAASAGGS